MGVTYQCLEKVVSVSFQFGERCGCRFSMFGIECVCLFLLMYGELWTRRIGSVGFEMFDGLRFALGSSGVVS